MSGERRRGSRLKLRFPIQLLRRDQRRVSAETDDLSINGFYCTCEEPLSPGEQLECQILIPDEANRADGGKLFLNCRARVVRVEVRGLQPGFGIACQFEDKRVGAG